MWLERKWLSECRIACQPETLKGTASHRVCLLNGLYTLPLCLPCWGVCVCVCGLQLIALFLSVCVLEPEKVLVGGCKSLSSSVVLRWVFGDCLESPLTGAQIDEVMVMDGSNKGLDVLSVVSDEAGMNYPSGAGQRHAAPPSPQPSALNSTHVPASLHLAAC